MAVNTTRPNREKIKPRFDSPVVVRLEQIHGIESDSPYSGLEYRYNVVGDRGPALLYVPAEGRDAILSVRPKVGDVIELLKYKNGPEIAWAAQLLQGDGSEPEPQPEAAPPARNIRLVAPAPRRPGYGNGHANRYVNGHANGQANGHRNGAGYFASLPPAQLQPEQPRPQMQIADNPRGNSHLAQCLCAAVDAAIEASEYARAKNYSVTFLGADIRAMASTLLINDATGGGR